MYKSALQEKYVGKEASGITDFATDPFATVCTFNSMLDDWFAREILISAGNEVQCEPHAEKVYDFVDECTVSNQSLLISK